MAILPIIKLFQPNLTCPGSCLRVECDTVSDAEFSSGWFHQLVQDMFETLYSEPSGVGLSANQVGILKKISVIDLKRDGKNPLVLVNPQIVPLSEEKVISNEVCLSFPNIAVKVFRHKKIKVLYQDITGASRELIAEGFKSNVYQHEISHLYGKTHVDLIGSNSDIEYYVGTASRKAAEAYQKCLTNS